MPRVACDPDGQRSVGAAAELAIYSPVGLESHQILRRVEAASRADGRHEVCVAGHEDDRVARVFADELQQPGSYGHIRLLLLPTDECTAAEWACLALGFEVAELELHAGRLEGREVRHLMGHRPGVSGFAMMSYCREVHNRGDGTAARQSVAIGPTQACHVQPAEWAPRCTLRVESGVIQVQAVDKERAAVDDCLQKRKNPGVATPGGPRDIPVGENGDSVSRARCSVKKSLQMSTFCRDRLTS